MLTARVLEKIISLTDENIETFYRALVEAAFNPTSSTIQSSKLQMLEKEYYSFLRNVLNPTNKNSIENKNRVNFLLTQFRSLQKEDFFKDKIDPNLIAAILIDISSNGKYSAILDEDTRIELLDRLYSIKNEIVYKHSQQKIREETEFLKKTKIQFELTSNDRLKVINGTSYKQTILLDDDAHEMARLMNDGGRESLQNKQYQEAIDKFKQAYKIELKDSRSSASCSSTLKLYQSNTALAQRLLASSIGKEAFETYGKKDYQKALEKYQNAAEVLNDIECQKPLDKETFAIYQLNISRCHHEIGRALQNKKQFKDALEQYIQAENIYKQLPAQQQKADELKKQELAVEATRNLVESTQENGEAPSSPVKMII